MSNLRDMVFSDDELWGLVHYAYARAEYMWERNRQDQHDTFTKLGTALQQVLRERDALRKGL